MAKTPLDTSLLQEALDLYAECGTKAGAARKAGLSITTFKDRLSRAASLGMTPQVAPKDTSALETLVELLRKENQRLKMEVEQACRPHFTIRQDNTASGERIRVVCIGDAHDSPHIPDKSRFEWISEYIRKQKPDVVVQIGDFATLDSLNTHVPDFTYDGRSKPTFTEDMESFNLALQALECGGAEKHVTLGNHERRLYLFEQNAPATFGMMQVEMGRLFDRYGWTFSPYGLIHYYGGVGFVHAAINRMGKTYGGKNAEQTIANDSLHDLIIGHSHIDRKHKASKIGTNKQIQIINVGCALPDGHIEDYAKHSSTGWSHGIADMVIQNGSVRDYNFISMARLEELFG